MSRVKSDQVIAKNSAKPKPELVKKYRTLEKALIYEFIDDHVELRDKYLQKSVELHQKVFGDSSERISTKVIPKQRRPNSRVRISSDSTFASVSLPADKKPTVTKKSASPNRLNRSRIEKSSLRSSKTSQGSALQKEEEIVIPQNSSAKNSNRTVSAKRTKSVDSLTFSSSDNETKEEDKLSLLNLESKSESKTATKDSENKVESKENSTIVSDHDSNTLSSKGSKNSKASENSKGARDSSSSSVSSVWSEESSDNSYKEYPKLNYKTDQLRPQTAMEIPRSKSPPREQTSEATKDSRIESSENNTTPRKQTRAKKVSNSARPNNIKKQSAPFING